MKKKFLLLVSILFIFTLSVFGCGGFSLSGGPSLSDTVYGNGGVAVVKGEYLYFTNAYLDYNSIGNNDNKFDRNGQMQKNYGIYRTKLNSDGVIEVDDNGCPVGAELLVPQVGGYSNAGLFICGEYLFYTTPYSGYKQGESELSKGLLRFERIKLNGSDHTVLSEGDYTADCKYYVNYFDGVTYISVLNNESIDVIKVKSNGDKSTYNIANSVKGMCTAEQKTIVNGASVNDVNKYVYYTKQGEDSKYTLCRKSLSGGEEENLIHSSTDDEISLVALKNNRIYFKQENKLRSYAFNNNDVVEYTSTQIQEDSSSSGIVSYAILDDTLGYAQDRGIVTVRYDGTNYLLIVFDANGDSYTISPEAKTKQITICFTIGNEVFYQIAEDEKLYAIDFSEKVKEERVVLISFDGSITVGETELDLFDYDADRMYYFSSATNSNGKLNYLHMADLEGNLFKDDSNNPVGQYIGILDSSDIVNK